MQLRAKSLRVEEELIDEVELKKSLLRESNKLNQLYIERIAILAGRAKLRRNSTTYLMKQI